MPLAKLAYETGRGVMERQDHQRTYFASEYIWHDIKYAKTVGIVDENDMKAMWRLEPVGVVAGVTLSPIRPLYYFFKSMICAKSEETQIIFGFHQRSKVFHGAAKIVRDAAIALKRSLKTAFSG